MAICLLLTSQMLSRHAYFITWIPSVTGQCQFIDIILIAQRAISPHSQQQQKHVHICRNKLPNGDKMISCKNCAFLRVCNSDSGFTIKLFAFIQCNHSIESHVRHIVKATFDKNWMRNYFFLTAHKCRVRSSNARTHVRSHAFAKRKIHT